MTQLIVRTTEGQEIVRQEMNDEERYAFYDACTSGELVTFHGMRWKVHSVAYRKSSQECVLLVSFDSQEPPQYYGDD